MSLRLKEQKCHCIKCYTVFLIAPQCSYKGRYFTHLLICESLPDAGRHAGIRGITFLLWGLAEVREAAANHRLTLVKHQVQPVVGQLDEDEEDSDGSTVDAQSHGGRGQSLGR